MLELHVFTSSAWYFLNNPGKKTMNTYPSIASSLCAWFLTKKLNKLVLSHCVCKGKTIRRMDLKGEE